MATVLSRSGEEKAGRRRRPRHRRSGRPAIVLAVLLGLSPVAVRADFADPVRVASSAGAATDCTLGIDVANNVYVVSVVAGRLVVHVIGPNLRQRLELPSANGAQGGPDIISNSSGTTFLAFHETHPDFPVEGTEIFLTHNRGGRFQTYTNLSRNAFEDASPRMDLDERGQPHIVWSQFANKGKDYVVYYNHNTGVRREIVEGTQPDVTVDRSGVAHVVFLRDHDIYYINDATGRFENEQKVVNTPTEDESMPSVTINERGDLYVTFEADGGLKFVTRAGDEPFGPQRLLDTGGITDPRLNLRANDLLTIVYAKQGNVHYIQGLSTFLLEPETLGESDDSRSRPNLVADLKGNLHACFLQDGEVYYTNNAGEIEADFTASPRTGEAPLTVEFQDLSSGDVAAWRWDFGDGELSRSSARNPRWTFNLPGKYTITLSVFNADRESTVVKKDFIVAQETFNSLEIPDQAVLPNQMHVWFPVIAAHREPIQGFQVMAMYDPGVLVFQGCRLDYTATRSVSPEFFECNQFQRHIEVGALFDFVEPFEFKTIPPGVRQNIVNLVYDVHPRAPQGGVSELRLVNDSGVSRIFNIFTVDGFSKFPSLDSSRVEILPVFPPPPFFLRGDVDGSRTLEITDPLRLLNFLFLGGPAPTCPDAADFNDKGTIDISGAIGLLNFLFLGGGPPRPPFPTTGIDPTPDNLAPCPR